MDALSVVLQLKRLVLDKEKVIDTQKNEMDSNGESKSKEIDTNIQDNHSLLPKKKPVSSSRAIRLVVGLSCFLEHPDFGVQRAAAEALLAACSLHRSVIISYAKSLSDIPNQEANEDLSASISSGCSSSISSSSAITAVLELLHQNIMQALDRPSGDMHVNQLCYKILELIQPCSKFDAGDISYHRSINDESFETNIERCDANGSHAEIVESLEIPRNSKPLINSTDICHHNEDDHQKYEDTEHIVEEEAFILALGFKQLQEDDTSGWKNENNFIRHLQQKLISISGVVSASVQVKNIDSFSQELNSSMKVVPSETIKGGLKMEIIAIVLIHLPKEKMKREDVLQLIRRDYYILKAQRLQSNRISTPSPCLSDMITNNIKSINNLSEMDEINNINQDFNDINTLSIIEDQMRDYDNLHIDMTNENVLLYVDEEADQPCNSDISVSDNLISTDYFPKWSFFNRNSILFGESRYLGRGAIMRSTEDPEFIDKLQKEKEKSNILKLKERKGTNAIDRVLDNFRSIKFW